ncbi:MAG: carbohydrate ABC transporter permease [Spirochaetales bacterium]
MHHTTKGERVFSFCNILFMVLLMAITLYPFLHVLWASISDPIVISRHRGLILWPKGNITLGAYREVFTNPNIIQGYFNTIIYVVSGTSLGLLLTSFGAYGLSRKKLLWKNFFMLSITFTLLFDGGLIPRYLLVRSLGLLNTRWAIIIPTAISTMNLIIMRTSLMSIPDSLEESAKLDGANDFTILFRIILPLSTAIIAVMILFYGVRAWNAWFYPMIYLRNRSLYPLQLILREILISNDTASMLLSSSQLDEEAIGQTIKYATVIVATAPILTVYPFVQKYFVKGVMIGAIKG